MYHILLLLVLLTKVPLIKSLELIEALLKYERKYTTQTIVTYESNRFVTKIIVNSKCQQKREVDVNGHTQW